MMKNIITVIVLFLSMLSAMAQERAEFKGRVTDMDGEPFVGATLVVLSADRSSIANGTVTDIDGNFELNAPVGCEIRVSFIGYENKIVRLSDPSLTYDIQLESDAVAIGEVNVVSVGYGEQDKRNITGSIGTFKVGETMSEMTMASTENLLQGKIPGVSVQFTTGDPTKKPIILIRGLGTLGRNDANKVSSPLFVIDGVEMTNLGEDENPLETINPEDIEDFSVLKDASAAAIYGSRAANGVILINTKRGVMGKPTITISNNVGVNLVGQLKNTAGGSLERRQKMDIWNRYNSHVDLPIHLTDSINPFWNNSTNWQDEVFRPSSYISNTISIRAASEVGNYSLSLNNNINNGNRRNSSTTRRSVRFLSDLRLWDGKMKITTQFNFSKNNNSRVSEASEAGVGNSSLLPSHDSPLLSALEDVDNRRLRDVSERMVTSVGFKLMEPIKNFIFNTSLDYNYYNQSLDDKLRYDYARSDRDIEYVVRAVPYETNNLTNNTTANYFNDFGRLNLNAIVGQSLQYYKYKDRSVSNDVRYSLSNTLSTTPSQFTTGSSDYSANSALSYFSRVNLNYDQRYLINMSIRADGSSKFGEDNRWGYFPAASFGWVFSNESFLSGIQSVINYGKFRASWGVTGNAFSDPYLAQGIMQNSARTYLGQSGLFPNFIKGGFQNKQLSWETSDQVNIGADMEFFNSRFEMTFDFYRKLNKDVLLDRALPNTSGYTKQDLNSASIVNQGIELSLRATIIDKDPFRWEMDANFASNENYVESIYGTNEDMRRIDDNGKSTGTIIRVGQSTNTLYYFRSNGIYQTEDEIPINPRTGRKLTFRGNEIKPGFPIYLDRNGDYNIDDLDRGVEGDPNPRFIGGFNNSFYYKKWYCHVYTSFLIDRDIINEAALVNTLFPDKGMHGAMPDLTDVMIWKNGGDDAQYPAVNPWAQSKPEIQDARYIEDGSYFKINSVTLGYRLTNTKWFKSMKVHATASNIYTFHNFSGENPEVVNPDGTYTNDYPLPISLSLGLNLVF